MWRRLLMSLMFFPVLAVAQILKGQNDLALDGGIMLLHGRIINQACDVAADKADQSVDMGIVSVKNLMARNENPVPFVIKLANCKPSIVKRAKVRFTQKYAGHNIDGMLAFAPGSTAKGAGIRLYAGDKYSLDLNDDSVSYLLSRGDSNELQFYAQVEAYDDAITNRSITPGQFSAVTYFTVSYE